MAKDNNSSLAEKLRGFRERVERKTKAARADNRAEARRKKLEEKRKSADERAQARRIEREEPDSVTETIAVKKKRLGEAKQEASALAEQSKDFAQARTGVEIDAGEAGGTIGDFAAKAGDTLDSLDTDEFADPLGEAGMNEQDMLTAEDPVDELGAGTGIEDVNVSDPVLEPQDDELL
jgi:hypothetical protein